MMTKQGLKARGLYFLQVGISAGLMAWILSRIHLPHVWHFYAALPAELIAGIALLSVLQLFIQFKRWRFLISQNSADYRSQDLLASFLLASPFG